MRKMQRMAGVGSLALLFALPLGSTSATAQTAPPIHGVNGTLATDGTIRGEHRAAHAIAEGAGRVVDGAKKLVSGGKGTKQPLDGFTEGRTVVLQQAAVDREASTTTEAVVIDVNKGRQQITVRFDDRKTQTLRLIDHAAVGDGTRPVIVSYTDQGGAKVAHEFRLVS